MDRLIGCWWVIELLTDGYVFWGHDSLGESLGEVTETSMVIVFINDLLGKIGGTLWGGFGSGNGVGLRGYPKGLYLATSEEGKAVFDCVIWGESGLGLMRVRSGWVGYGEEDECIKNEQEFP